MANTMDKLAKELKNAMTASDERKPKPYDAQAEVLRVEDGVAWVHIPGGVDETPVRLTINAKKGDKVNIHVANGSAWITGNSTNPPTDDTTAIHADQVATIAHEAAEKAWTEAESAHEAADQAWAYADSAHEAADAAWTEAERAYGEAERATGYANDSLAQLGVVEDVAGTLNWITTHATYKATSDTEVRAGKWYFTKSGDTYNVVINPTGNPSTQGWYEIDTIDEAVSNYIQSHLALTDAGLWVTKDNNGYKILLANDGMKVYDNAGHLVSTFGESITFDSERPQKIGNNNVYIEYYDSNNDGHPDAIRIKADEFLLSSGKTIQEELEAIETWFYSIAPLPDTEHPNQSNAPANEWTTTNLKEQHLRDIYFDTTSGKSYRWAKEGSTYKWVEIEDVELAALAKDLHDNYPPRSEFTVAPDQIQSTVSAAQTAATNAANTATDNKLTNYSTTTQMNSAITQKANEITQSVSQTYQTKDAMSGYYTKTQTDSAITTKAGEISLSVAQTEIGKIEIGGRNLLRGTDILKLNSGYVDWEHASFYKSGTAGTLENVTLPSTPIASVTKGVKVTITTVNSDIGIAQDLVPIRKQTVTQSVWVKGTAGDSLRLQTMWSNQSGAEESTTRVFTITDSDWHRYSYSYEPNHEHLSGISAGYIYVRSATVGHVFYICADKLEYGTKATDWTLAPEDVDDRVDTLETFKSEFTVTPSAISSEVVATQNGATLVSRINQTADSVKISANHVEIDGAAIYNTIWPEGDNLLAGTLNPVLKDANKPTFSVWSGGDGTGTIATITDSPATHYTKSFRITGNTSGNRDFGQWVPDFTNNFDNGEWLFTAWVRGIGGNATALVRAYPYYTYTQTVGTTWTKIQCLIKLSGTKSSESQFQFGITNAGSIEYIAPKLEVAHRDVHTVNTSYSYTYQNILTYSAEGYGSSDGATWNVASSVGIKVGDEVRLKVTVSDMNNAPVYIVGTVTAINSKTQIKMISHGLDTTIVDGGNIITNSIGANQIKAHSINSQHLVISDSTNLATVNELYPDSVASDWYDARGVVSGGYVIKNTATQTYLMVSSKQPSSFKQYDELYYEAWVKAAVAGTVNVGIWGYNASGGYVSGSFSGNTHNFTTSETKITGSIKLSNAVWNSDVKYYYVGFADEKSTKSQIYVRKVIFRRKNAGELIVDGSITTSKLDANAVTIGKINQSDSSTASAILNSSIEVGGKNIALTSGARVYPADYMCARIPLAERLEAGVTYTFQMWGVTVSNTNTGTNWIRAYWGGGNNGLGETKMPDANGYFCTTFTVNSTAVARDPDGWHWYLQIYNSDQATARNFSVKKWKLEKGNKPTDWSPCPADAHSGENLIRGTRDMMNGNGSYNTGTFRASGGVVGHANFSVSNPPPIPELKGYLTVTNNGSSAQNVGFAQDLVPNKAIVGKQYTQSCWVCCSSSVNGCYFYLQPWFRIGSALSGPYCVKLISNAWQYVEFTGTLTGTQGDTYSGGYGYAASVPAGGAILIAGLKVEEGTLGTGWAPAEEEADASTYITQINEAGIRIHPSSTENNSVVINASGMEVFKGGTASANSVAFYGDSARIGKLADSHVDIGANSITMQVKPSSSEALATAYEVKQVSTTVKTTRTYNVRTTLGNDYRDRIYFGRLISSGQKIILKYKINNGSVQTVTYNTFTVSVYSGSTFQFSCDEWSNNVKIQFGTGATAADTDVLTLISIEFSFITGQQVVENAVGLYANMNDTGVFRVGNGISSTSKSNAMLVCWDGTTKIGGDIIANCAADSSGGISLTKDMVDYNALYVSGSNYWLDGVVHRVGNVVTLDISANRNSSIGSGSNLFSFSLASHHVPVPLSSSVTGMSYYGAHAIGILLEYDAGDYKLIVRNASNSAVTVSNVLKASLTYVCETDLYTDS